MVVPQKTVVVPQQQTSTNGAQQKTVVKNNVSGLTEEISLTNGTNGRNVAHITVNLPSDARLWVDDVVCPLTSSTRSFDTPVLQPGQKYYYTLKVEVDRNGQTLSEARRVYVAAGQQVSVDFNSIVATTTVRR